jgi:hypothetical protein
VRLKHAASPHPLDVYDYYWGDRTGARATAADIRTWVATRARAAARFYRRRALSTRGRVIPSFRGGDIAGLGAGATAWLSAFLRGSRRPCSPR